MLVVQRVCRVSCAGPRFVAAPRKLAVAVDPVVARARQMQKMSYDSAKEGQIMAPAYDGWDMTIQNYFEKLSTGEKTGGRPSAEVCYSALDLIGFTPMVRMSRLAKFFDIECELLANKDRIGKRDGTAEEIVEQVGGKLDYMIMSADTGGTISGIAKKLKEKIPGVKIVAVDPDGSVLAEPDSLNDGSARTGQKSLKAYQVEGIGCDFIPTVLDREVADHWVKTDDEEAFAAMRAIVRHEGLLIGSSCGSTMAGAFRFIKEHNIGKDKRVAVLFADSSRNYMSKMMDDDWIERTGFDIEPIHKAVNEKGFYARHFGL